jgi:hypothetical protein
VVIREHLVISEGPDLWVSIPSVLRRKGDVEVTQCLLHALTQDGVDLSLAAGCARYPFDWRLSGHESPSCWGSIEKQNP